MFCCKVLGYRLYIITRPHPAQRKSSSLKKSGTQLFQVHFKPRQAFSRKVPVVSFSLLLGRPTCRYHHMVFYETSENFTDRCTRWSQTLPSSEDQNRIEVKKYFEVLGHCPIKSRKSPNVCQGCFDVMDPASRHASETSQRPIRHGRRHSRIFFDCLRDNVCRSTHHPREEVGL
jgi:hypothetical protein